MDIVDKNHGLHQVHSLNSWLTPMSLLSWGTLSIEQGIEYVNEGGECRVSCRPHTPPMWTI